MPLLLTRQRIALALVTLVAFAQPAFAQEHDAETETVTLPLESLFYSEKETQSIRSAIGIYLKRQGGSVSEVGYSPEEFVDKASEIKRLRAQSRYFTYPQFFLDSIVFHSEADWSIWVNGRKITSENPAIEGELEVQDINENAVALLWRPLDIERVKEVWDKWPNEYVDVDFASGTVRFSLLPNQTFSSYVMRVVEGRVVPVTIDNKIVEEEILTIKNDAPAEIEEDNVMPAPQNAAPVDGRKVGKEIIGIFGASE